MNKSLFLATIAIYVVIIFIISVIFSMMVLLKVENFPQENVIMILLQLFIIIPTQLLLSIYWLKQYFKGE